MSSSQVYSFSHQTYLLARLKHVPFYNKIWFVTCKGMAITFKSGTVVLNKRKWNFCLPIVSSIIWDKRVTN